MFKYASVYFKHAPLWHTSPLVPPPKVTPCRRIAASVGVTRSRPLTPSDRPYQKRVAPLEGAYQGVGLCQVMVKAYTAGAHMVPLLSVADASVFSVPVPVDGSFLGP